MKRAIGPTQYIKCQDCDKRIMVALAKKGICPACRVGMILDVRISDKSATTEPLTSKPQKNRRGESAGFLVDR
jgi:hypothetical protein